MTRVDELMVHFAFSAQLTQHRQCHNQTYVTMKRENSLILSHKTLLFLLLASHKAISLTSIYPLREWAPSPCCTGIPAVKIRTHTKML